MGDEEERKPRVIGSGKVLRGSSASIEPIAQPSAPPAAPPPGPAKRPGVVSADDYEARTTAKQIVADAQKERERILAEANEEKAKIYEKAAADAKADVMAQASEDLARAKMQAGQMLKNMEGEILDLALKIAAKIIGRDLERDPEVVMEIAATAIEHARAAKAMVLRVNPADGATLRHARPKLMELIGRTVELSIRDDVDVERGGCIIQTEFGTIDGQIRTQFQMLENVLKPDTAKKEGPK
jgi:type III secretion protein L